MDDLISVIIPVYNSHNSIRKCLDSVVNQTYNNIEIIVVDDGSSDDSCQIIDEFRKKDARIIFYRQEHLGASSARNLGLSVAHGVYIGFADSDDWIEPDMYEILLKNLKKYKSDIGICGYNTIKRGIVSKRHCSDATVIMDTNELLKEFFSWNLIGAAVWSKLYKKTIFDELCFENYSYKEDVAIMYHILAKCKKGVHIGLPKYNYVIQETSVYRRPFDSSKMCTVKILEDLLSYIRGRFPFLIQDALLYAIRTYFELLDDILKLDYPQKYQNDICICINSIQSMLKEDILAIEQKETIIEKINAIHSSIIH